jgi:L-methionine (R)-S-oxide reductase
MSTDFKKILSGLEDYRTGHWLSDFANFSALIFNEMAEVNWAGFYLDNGSKLILGPFCGKPACTEISYTRGVCGDAFSKKLSIRVSNVDDYPGHIRCDSASKSELVIPLLLRDEIFGVFDLDSPKTDRFSLSDQKEVEQLVQNLLIKLTRLPHLKAQYN